MGSILWDSLAGARNAISNRRRKKRASGELKRKKNGFSKRIMKIMRKSPAQTYTMKKMCQLLKVKGDMCAGVIADVMGLVNNYKLVWEQQRAKFGLFEYWIPLDKITEQVLACLADGHRMTFTELWYGAIRWDTFNTWRFEFNMGKLVDDLVAVGAISWAKNEDGGRVFYFTPEQFFEYRCRDARSSSNG